MRLFEYEAADIFESVGIPVPRRGVVESCSGALDTAAAIGYPVMVKAQVLAGGRGLAGGVRTASSPSELKTITQDLFNGDIDGLAVRKLVIAERVTIQRELYLGITIDGFSGVPVVVAGVEGGVEIEKTAMKSPEKVASVKVDTRHGFYPYQARALFHGLGLSGRLLVSCADAAVKLYNIFTRIEALVAEINPLAVLPGDGVSAVDAVLDVDDSAVSRVRSYSLPDPADRAGNALECKGREMGVTYVDLDGDIGLISSGAGLGMATMDIIGDRMRPANFLETGGGITEKLLYGCMELVMMKPGLRGLLINLYGGINPIQEGAEGIARYVRERKVTLPIVAKALGNHQEETWRILRSAGVHVVTDSASEAAVDRLYELLEAGDELGGFRR
jgi:succinyl-CoA synthetase beta subunit